MTKLKQILVIAATLGAAIALAPGLSAQTLKLGVFDPQAVSEGTEIGKQVQAQLTAFRDKKQSEITQKEAHINELQKQLAQQELSLSRDKRSTMETDIQRQLLDLQSAREAATRELQLEVAAAQGDFEQRLITAVETFGRDEGFSVILDRSLVAFSDKTVDVTTAIIDRFNRMYPTSAEN